MKHPFNTNLPIILGSSSKWRQNILMQAGIPFTVMSPDIDEKGIRHNDPKTLTLAIAHAKADVLLPKIKTPSLLITVDQVVTCHGEIFEKPQTQKDVYDYYACYEKYPAQTVTAVVVTNTQTQKRAQGVDIATIYLNPVPKAITEAYIQKGNIFHCAGGFQIEGEKEGLNPYVRSIEGNIDSIQGLPMTLVKQLITHI